MNRAFKIIAICLIASLLIASDIDLFTEGKMLMLDKDWKGALGKFENLIKEYPEGKYSTSASFYKAKCLQELGRSNSALQEYKYFIKKSDNRGLQEEAKIAVIDISYDFYIKGQTDYLNNIYDYLENDGNVIVRYYSALKLSKSKDKKIALKAAPVLLDIMKIESDKELKNRAKIALLRINPELIDQVEKYSQYKSYIIVMEIVSKNPKEEGRSIIRLPLAFTDLLLEAISEEDIGMNIKGIADFNKLMDSAMKNAGEIITIDSEKAILKIWVENKP